MTYYVAEDVKKFLGEAGGSNDAKVALYGEMADTYIDTDLTNVEVTVPIPSPPELLTRIASLLATAYFYKYEAGDTITAEQTERIWEKYFTATYKRPRFKARTT